MKVSNCYLVLLITLYSLSLQMPAQAAVIDISAVGFTSFAPDPIESGQRLTSFGYAYDFNKETNATVSAGFSFSITLSPNAAFGDIDDISLGTLNGASSPLGGISGHVSGTTSNPNGITSFQVPPETAPGEYNAFLLIAPRSPHVDPDSSDAIGQLSGTVTVGTKPGLAGDYNDNGVVDAADYTVWRNNLGGGTSLPNDDSPGVGQDDYDRWKTHFGETADSGALAGANAAVPEPATLVMFLLGMPTVLCRRRAPVS
jgi:hypothetical protein